MDKPEVIESNHQLIEAWKYLANKCPKGEILQTDGLSINWGNTNHLFFNFITLLNPIQGRADLEAKIKIACHYAHQRQRSWMFVVCEEYLPEELRPQLDALFSTHQMSFLIKMTGMATDKLVAPVSATSALDCYCVDSWEKRKALAEINAISHEMPSQELSETLEREECWGENAFGTLGYLGDKAVSAAMTLLLDDRFYLGFVATLPEYRNQGYATRAIQHTLAQAKEKYGSRRYTLHASQVGLPVYQKLGYQSVASFSCYTGS